ncbi:MAG: D-2-hydroxyacid dehydrogenase [Candidatus Omnitrophica bacterium]|nr:D-2-hydroxyacid dehydrogenase [Candidatus Omnitrophota bacterium]MCM8816824.1 D-2-hydroxyacid dehydrogenase [Candidatus Omnitrophota bacterium]
MTKIFVDMAVEQSFLTRLKKMKDVSVDVVEEWTETQRQYPRSRIEDVDILFCTFVPTNFSDMKKLKLIQLSSSGYSQLFGLDLAERGIRACNARGVFDTQIAEWNIAMMINLVRNLREMIRNQEKKIWQRKAEFQNEIRGKVVGFWGYGGIARETARIASLLGLRIYVLVPDGKIKKRENIYCVEGTGDPEGKIPDRVFSLQQKKEFLSGIDFLILSMPLTEKTRGIVGEEELRTLRKGCFLLNPARGPLIQEEALIKVLKDGHLAGAAIDAHFYYPMPPEHPLWSFPNVIMTPHISGSSLSPHFLERIWTVFTENVVRFLENKPLLNELTPSQLKGE